MKELTPASLYCCQQHKEWKRREAIDHREEDRDYHDDKDVLWDMFLEWNEKQDA